MVGGYRRAGPNVGFRPATGAVCPAGESCGNAEDCAGSEGRAEAKAEARRNKMLGEWAAGLLGITGEGVEDYVKAVVRADLAQKGDEDVFQKIRADFDAKGVSVSDAELRAKMDEFLREAVEQIEGSK